jgi:hypothetical protein
MEQEGKDKKEKPGIKVVDRRQFTSDGDRRGDAPEEAAPEPAHSSEPTAPDPTTDPVAAEGEAGFERRPIEEPAGVDFTMLVNAMATPALIMLGEVPHPDSGEPTVHLEQARIQIDMLDLLRVKCRGNLEPSEERLLEEVLYQLRMRYVAKSGTPG